MWAIFVCFNLNLRMGFPFAFKTSYNHFYLYDKGSFGNTGSDDFWTESALDDRLAIEEGILGIGTESYGPVKGELFLLEASNHEIRFEEYDHVVEASFAVNSEVVQILDCPNSSVELELPVKPGIYRVRIYSSNLASFDIDERDEGDDFYKIEIWPDVYVDRKVLKRFNRIAR